MPRKKSISSSKKKSSANSAHRKSKIGTGETPDHPIYNTRSEDVPEYSIIIEYDHFVTRFDLDEILSSIDRIIEDELLSQIYPEYKNWSSLDRPYTPRNRKAPELSYIGITSVDRGSIVLTVAIYAAVALYGAYGTGLYQSVLIQEIIRSGRLTGDLIGSKLNLKRFNDWAEGFVQRQVARGGNIKKVKMKRRSKK